MGARSPARSPSLAPRQVASRIIAIVAVGVLVVVLHFTGVLDRLQRQLFPPKLDWHQDYAVVEHLRDLVVQDGLTTDRKACLLFVINGNDPSDAQRIQVWEKRSGGCAPAGAAPAASRGPLPVLFTLRVDRDHGTVQSDRGSPGQFHDVR